MAIPLLCMIRGDILKEIEESDLVYLLVPACLYSQNTPHCVRRYIKFTKE